MMTIKVKLGVMVLVAIAFCGGVLAQRGVALAVNKHVEEAVELAKGAASHGKEGHADACLQHAEEALKHVQAAGVKNPHADEGIKRLKEAVEQGKAGHADACTKHVEGAATHLAEVK